MTPSRALCVRGELVLTTMPGCTGHAQDATGFGALSTSTRHIRQLPAIINFLFFSLSVLSVRGALGWALVGGGQGVIRTRDSNICSEDVS